MAVAEGDFEQRLREANEELYKHSHELAVRNKTLSLLRQLYQISIATFDPEVLAEEIVTTIRSGLDFELAGILLLEGDTLSPLRFSKSERFESIAAAHNHPFTTQSIANISTIPFFAPILKGEPAHSTELSEFWGTVIPQDVLSDLAETGHIKQVSAHPLIIDRKIQGILVLALNRPIDEISQFERESIDSLVDVVAIALDRAHLYQEVKAANERQVTLIHFITHQIKGFVTKSRNIFSLALEGDFGPVSDQLRPMLQAGFDSDTQGVNTIQEILNAANIKSGKVTYTMQPFDLKALIEEIAGDLRATAEKRGLVLNLALGSEPVMVNGDREKLKNAYRNLVDNSIKYTLKGHVDVSLGKEGGKVVFKVEDTGIGISPEDMQNLFTEGGHGKESVKVNVESTGFGLYIVKNIIDAHHGRVWAESEGAGKGSRFFVELPG